MVALGLPGPEMLKYELLYNVADGRTGAAPLFFLGKDGVGAAWLKQSRAGGSPRGVSALPPLTAEHQRGWKDTLESLAAPDKGEIQLTGQKKSITKNKEHRAIFLKLGFGRKRRKATFHCAQKLPPLGFACPELHVSSAPGL